MGGIGPMRKSRISQRLDIRRFLRYLTNIPDSSLDRLPDLGQIRRVYILRFISIIAIMTLILLGIRALVQKNIPVGISDLFLASVLIGNILHARRYKQYTFNIYLGVSLAAILFVYMFLTGAMNRNGFVWFYTFPVVAFFLLGSKKGTIATVLISSPVVALFLMKTPPSIFVNYSFDFKLRFISSFFVVSVFSYLFEYSREKNHEELQRAHDDLEKRVDERTSALQEAIQSLQKEISERRRIEEALRQSKEKYRTILEKIEDAYYEVDLAGNLTFFNDSMCRIWGYPREELMGMNDRQYTDKENAKKLFQAFNKVYRTGEPRRECDWEIIRKDGTKRYIEASVSLRKDSSDKPIGFRGIIRDATERKQMEEALRQSEERYRTILEDIEEGYLETDLAGHFTFVNDVVCKRLGYSREQLIGMNNRQLTDEETAKKLFQAFSEVYRTGEPSRGREWEIIKKDGTKWIYEFSASLIRNSEGRPIGFRGTSRDITERKQMEEALRQSEERYRTILEDIEEGYFELDLAGNFTFANDALCRRFGYPREQLIGMNNRQYSDEKNAKKLYQAFNRLYRTGEPIKALEAESTRRDGTKEMFEISVFLIRDSEGKPIGFRGTSRDVTERKQAEEAIETEDRGSRTFQSGVGTIRLCSLPRSPGTSSHGDQLYPVAGPTLSEQTRFRCGGIHQLCRGWRHSDAYSDQ